MGRSSLFIILILILFASSGKVVLYIVNDQQTNIGLLFQRGEQIDLLEHANGVNGIWGSVRGHAAKKKIRIQV